MSRARNAAAWVLAATVLLVLVVWTNLTGFGIGATQLTYDDVALPRLVVAVTGALLAWLALSVGLTRREEPRSALLADATWAVLCALGVWAVVSALASDQGPTVWLGQSERLEGVVTIALYGVLFGAGLQVGRSSSALNRLAVALVVGATSLSGHGILQMIGRDASNYRLISKGLDANYARASLGNPNFLGAVLVLALPVSLMLIARARGWALRGVLGLATLAMLVALWGTESQGAWFAVILEVAALAAYWAKNRRKGPVRTRIIAAVAGGIVVAGVVAVVAVSALVPNLGHGLSESFAERAELIRIAQAASADHPLTGWGPDTFLAAFRANRGDAYVALTSRQSTNNNAHSWLPQFGATLGIPGALLLLASLALALWRGRPRASREPELLRAGLWVGALGLTAHLLTSVAVLAATVPFWVLLGALAAPRAKELQLPRPAALAAVALTAVLLAASVAVSARLVAADRSYLRSRLAFVDMRHAEAIALADKAVQLNPTSAKYARGAAQARVQRVLEAGGQPGVQRSSVESPYIDAQAAFSRFLGRFPGDYPARAWQAGMQGSLGSWFTDAKLLQASRTTARSAMRFDRIHWEVTSLASGEATQGALNTALSVSGLP